MNELTPPAQRLALAERHRAMMGSAQRGGQQRVRLRLLQAWGQRYPRLGGRPTRRVLVIRPDHLGDLLFATHAAPAAPACPMRTSPCYWGWGETVLAGNPDLDAVLTCPFQLHPPAQGQPAAPTACWRPSPTAGGPAFDLALVLRFDHGGGWLARRACIPQRLGYAIAECSPSGWAIPRGRAT